MDAELILKYIPVTIQNYVSVFDLDKQTFLGPKYKGHHLFHTIEKCRSLQQDSIIYLYMMANVVKYYVKIAFLYKYSVLFESNGDYLSGEEPSKSRAGSRYKINQTKI